MSAARNPHRQSHAWRGLIDVLPPKYRVITLRDKVELIQPMLDRAGEEAIARFLERV